MRCGRSGRELPSSDAAAHDFAAAHAHADNTWSFAGALAGAHAPALGTNTPGRSRSDAEADGADASTNNCTDAEADIYASTDAEADACSDGIDYRLRHDRQQL